VQKGFYLRAAWFPFLCFFAGIHPVQSQTDQEAAMIRSALNEYVLFANESIHGMLIAHRLFENYNQDLNKYVDLPGHQLNFYNNRDLPGDIFDDPDHWFYEQSPLTLFQSIIEKRGVLSPDTKESLDGIAQNIRATTLASNALRIKVGESLNTLDLSNKDMLYSVYRLLEEAVDAYDLFQAELLLLESELYQVPLPASTLSQNEHYSRLVKLLDDIHSHSIAALLSIRAGEKDEIRDIIPLLEMDERSFQSFSLQAAGGFVSSSYIRSRKRILQNLSQIREGLGTFLGDNDIPEEYALYGKNYYYYNTQIINKVNRYGNGLVQAVNQLIDLLDLPMIHRLEMPHYLEIIYPTKVEKQVPVISSSMKEIDEVPHILEDRTVVMSDAAHVIYVDSMEPELEVFDHLKQDGDIISLNFNGDWVFRNLSLERKPRKFILKLNPSGKNFLILHAVNEGSVPPNTIGINYIHRGRKKRHIMQSNLRTSQVVEIIMSE